MDELLEQFIIEGRELLQQTSDDLLALELEPENQAHIDSAFRAIHTLKGSVGLFDLGPMQTVLHAAEDTLGGIRSGHAAADRAMIDILLDCIGVHENWMDFVAEAERLPADAEAESRRLIVC